MTRQNLVPVLALTLTLFILAFFYSGIDTSQAWRGLPQHVGLGEQIGRHGQPPSSVGSAEPSKDTTQDADYANWNPRPIFKPGSPMPPEHNYTSTLVIAKTKKEDVSWILNKMPEQQVAIYFVDDASAPLHPPKNKGHEVMVYLSWIIDNYDKLPDVAIFMHAHQTAWHNDDLLGHDAHLLVTRLNRHRVWREGFVNMKCSWHPGCPDWIHPGNNQEGTEKPEQFVLAKSWSEIFPLDPVPTVLAQPCCGQFALSRERIQAKPHAQYVWYRDWLFNTRLDDVFSGRVWEYIWQFVFTGQNIYCPKEHICFCDQYGWCFGGEEAYENFMTLKNELGGRKSELQAWEEKQQARKEAQEEGDAEKLKKLEIPEVGKDDELRREIDRLGPIVDGLKHDAEIRGRDPRNRALEAGREWHEGDSF